MQEPVGNGRALVAGIDPDPRETLRAIREQLQIEQVHGNAKLLSQDMENETLRKWHHDTSSQYPNTSSHSGYGRGTR